MSVPIIGLGKAAKLSWPRVVLAFLVAPAFPVMLVYAITFVVGDRNWSVDWYIGWFLALGYSAALLVGVPTFAVLAKVNKQRLVVYAWLGVLFGLLCYLPFYLPGVVDAFQVDGAYGLDLAHRGIGGALIAMVLGGLGSTVFWMIALWRLPD